jgi:hypothetical protein
VPAGSVIGKPGLAALVYAALLSAMAAGQLASLGRFEDALSGYGVFGPAAESAAVAVPVAELAVAGGLLILPVRRAAGALGLAVALFWAALAAQAFARGLELENCGCFGAYLVQELRWWVLLEDAEFLLLAWWTGARTGLPLPLPRFARRRSESQPPMCASNGP